MLENILVVIGDELLPDVKRELSGEIALGSLAHQLLSAQIDIICRSGVGFAGLHISRQPNSKIAGLFDRETKQLQLILGANNPLSDTLSHEIVHAIEFTSGVKSEEKVHEMTLHVDFTQCNNMAQTFLAQPLQGKFDLQTNVVGRTREKFYQELGSFVFESLFSDIKRNGELGIADFKKRFGEFESCENITLKHSAVKKQPRGTLTYEDRLLRSKVQEIVAVSIYDINQVIIDSLDNTSKLKQHLINANTSLKPAYDSAKVRYPNLWHQTASESMESPSHPPHPTSRISDSSPPLLISTAQGSTTLTPPATPRVLRSSSRTSQSRSGM